MRATYEGLNSLYVTLLIKYKLRNNVLTIAAVMCRKMAFVKHKTSQHRYFKEIDGSC